MRIYLVRHGETDWNDEGKMQGHRDVPLNERGLAQARALGEAFRDIPIDRILTSDLSRARQTAEEIGRTTGVAIEICAELRERSFGDWEGMPYQLLADQTQEIAQYMQLSLFQIRPPKGESFADLWNRLRPVSLELAKADETVALVVHGGTCATMLSQIIRATQETVRSFRFSNASVTALERRPKEGLFVIVRFDDVSHLGPFGD